MLDHRTTPTLLLAGLAGLTAACGGGGGSSGAPSTAAIFAGLDASALSRARVTLEASVTGGEGVTSFEWLQLSGPPVSLEAVPGGPAGAISFLAPDRDAQLEQRDAALRERESALREKSEALEEAEASASAARREADALRAELASLRDVTIASGEGQGSDSELFDVPLLLDQDQDQDQSAVVEDEEAEEVGEAGGEEA